MNSIDPTTKIEPGRLDNVLLLALILSACLHAALLYSDIELFSDQQSSRIESVTDNDYKLLIPIEFIPDASGFVSSGNTSVSREVVLALVQQAQNDDQSPSKLTTRGGVYSFTNQQVNVRRYLQKVREEIEKFKYQNADQPRRELIGNARVVFVISATGEFQQAKIIESSGDVRIDHAAIAAIDAASGKIKRSKETGSRAITTSAVIKYQYGL